jgi:hypothetical protein
VEAAVPPNWQQMSEQLRRYTLAEYGVDLLAVTFHLAYLGDTKKPLALPRGSLPSPAFAPPAAPDPPAPPAEAAPRLAEEQYSWEPWHSENFEMICVRNRKFEFGPVARLIVKKLWDAWASGRPDVEAATLRRFSGAQTAKLSTLFANNPAWGLIIVKGAGSSCLRLSMRCASDPPDYVDPTEEEPADDE